MKESNSFLLQQPVGTLKSQAQVLIKTRFGFYEMKGMEDEPDENKDGLITAGELQNYLSEMVSRQAMVQNRKQQPQLIGDGGKLVVSK